MAVNLSPLGGVGAQFFDSNGNPLSGGLIYTYAAGTNTPQATFTTSSGLIQHSNPIVLDAAGRVPTGEIWLTDGLAYKFVIQTSAAVLVGTYDNIVGINSNFVAYTSQQEIQTATAGQTVFNLTTMQYQPGTNNLTVYVDGVNQYGPGAQYAYVETDSDTVTFVSGLHVGASVKFTTATPVSSGSTNAENVAYNPPFTGAVGTNVENKLAQTVSVKDFGAVGDGVTDDTTAIQNAVDSGANAIYVPVGIYETNQIEIPSDVYVYGDGGDLSVLRNNNAGDHIFRLNNVSNVTIEKLGFDGNLKDANQGIAATGVTKLVIKGCKVTQCNVNGIYTDASSTPVTSSDILITENYIDSVGFAGISHHGNNAIISNNISINSGNANISFDGENIVVEGNIARTSGTADNYTGYGQNNKNITVVGNYGENSSNNGMHIGGNNITVSNNTIKYPGHYGIIVQSAPNSPAPTPSVNTIVSNNMVYDVPGTNGAITVNYYTGVSVIGNLIDGNAPTRTTGAGINILNSSEFSVSGNTVRNLSDGCIKIYSSTYGTITGNNVSNSTSDGIVIINATSASSNISIDSNVVTGCLRSIRAAGGVGQTGIMAYNNICKGNTTNAIDIANTIGYVANNLADTFVGVYCLTSDSATLAGTRNGFFDSVGDTKQSVTGSRGGNTALASLLDALNKYGLILNSTSA